MTTAVASAVDLHYHRRALRLLQVPHGHPLRRATEARLCDAYQRCHAGAPKHFPARLFALIDARDTVLATAGLCAGNEGLSARYLPVPPNELVSGLTRADVSAGELLEIGQLTACQRGMAPALIVALTSWLAQHEARWGIATATVAVRKLLSEMGIATQPLLPARPQSLGNAAGGYGRYYEAEPWVICGRIDDAARALAQRGYVQRMRVVVTEGATTS